MGKQIKGLLYFLIMDIRYSLLIFWTIIIGVLIVSITFSYFLLSVEDGDLNFGLSVSVYIYCAIVGFLMVKDSIPFSLKMGATRKNIFISIGVFFLLLAFAKAIAANLLHSIILFFTDRAGINTFHFLHPANLIEDTWLNRVIIDGSIMFLLFSFMFILGLLFYKYGLAGGGSVTGILVVVLLFGVAKGWVFDFFADIFAEIDVSFFFQLLAAGIVLYAFTFFLLRKITILKVK